LIRSQLLEYDLTRLDSYWVRNLSPSPDILANTSVSIWTPWAQVIQQKKRSREESRGGENICLETIEENETTIRWWQTRLIGEYSPSVHLQNPSLDTFLNSHSISHDDLMSIEQERSLCLLPIPPSCSCSLTSLLLSSVNPKETICEFVFEMRSAIRGRGGEDEEALWADYWILMGLVVICGGLRARYHWYLERLYDLDIDP
jgi:hypothetical protein